MLFSDLPEPRTASTPNPEPPTGPSVPVITPSTDAPPALTTGACEVRTIEQAVDVAQRCRVASFSSPGCPGYSRSGSDVIQMVREMNATMGIDPAAQSYVVGLDGTISLRGLAGTPDRAVAVAAAFGGPSVEPREAPSWRRRGLVVGSALSEPAEDARPLRLAAADLPGAARDAGAAPAPRQVARVFGAAGELASGAVLRIPRPALDGLERGGYHELLHVRSVAGQAA